MVRCAVWTGRRGLVLQSTHVVTAAALGDGNGTEATSGWRCPSHSAPAATAAGPAILARCTVTAGRAGAIVSGLAATPCGCCWLDVAVGCTTYCALVERFTQSVIGAGVTHSRHRQLISHFPRRRGSRCPGGACAESGVAQVPKFFRWVRPIHVLRIG